MRGKKSLVGIGLPVYNGEKYLRQALDALLAQDYGHFELVISDNASTDSTPHICAEYLARDPRIRYHRNSTNVGAAQNFRRVLDYSQGEYFMWAAHDDLWQPSYISKCVAKLEAAPEAVLCCTSVAMMDEEGKLLSKLDTPFATSSPSRARRISRLLSHSTPWFSVYGLMRAEALKRTAPLKAVWGLDVVILAELCLLGSVVAIPEPLFFYRTFRNKTVADTLSGIDPSSKRKSELPLWKDLSIAILRTIRCSDMSWIGKARVMAAAVYALGKRWPLWLKEDLERRSYPRYVQPAEVNLERGRRFAPAGDLMLAMLHNPFYLFSCSIWLLLLQAIFGSHTYATVRRVFRGLFPRRL